MKDPTSILLVATLAFPLALLILACMPRLRALAFGLQWLAPLPGMAAALSALASGPVKVSLPAGFALVLDRPGAMLLAAAALLWMTISAAIRRDLESDTRFGFCWLMTMTGSLGVFVSADLVSFYLLYALVSLPAYGLFAFSGDSEDRRAGAVYMAFAILGEAILLLAFAALAALAPDSVGLIGESVRALGAAPSRGLIAGLLIAGFGMKLGMVPFGGWMPLNYKASPIPVAAVLSGAGVKAGVIGLIRFLPFDIAAPDIGHALAAAGFLSVFAGVAIGLTQRNVKAILAYSSISQMGTIAAALGMALAAGNATATSDLAFYSANHLLVKACLFLAVGVMAAKGERICGWRLALVAALALDLAGLPVTGGALAKLASKPQFDGAATYMLATLSSVGSAWLMTHFLIELQTPPQEAAGQTPRSILALWPVLALGAILAPYLLFPIVGPVAKAFEPAVLWDGAWPVAVGVGLAVALRRLDARMPAVSTGDGIVVYEAAFHRLMEAGPMLDAMDLRLRAWPVAGVSFLLVALALLAAGVLPG